MELADVFTDVYTPEVSDSDPEENEVIPKNCGLQNYV